MLSQSQFVRIAEMQNAMQVIALGEDWRTQGKNYATAVFVEAAECINHLGWEWWKQPTPNIEQARMEVVDMLHFIMCGVLLEPAPPAMVYAMIEQGVDNMETAQFDEMASWDTATFVKEASLCSCVNNFPFAIYLIDRAAQSLGMTSDDLFTAYVGKNMLNRFRKANGYKEGTYVKMWNGREDNEFLTEIITTTDPTSADYETQITARLQATYDSIDKSVAH
jgi:dimeric dUTPase (all-alpha-NTP-PPase superfamily)